jgi:CubicO group peptidase (beta-lactamase class C family)
LNVGLVGLVCTLAACAHSASSDVAVPAPTLSPDWTALHHFVDSALAAGAAPGLVVAASWPGGHHIYGAGRLGDGAPDRPDRHTQYDLASLTKVVGLTTAMMFAVDEGRIDLDTPIQAYVPAFQGAGKERVTVRMLLAHAGGLPAWRPFYRQAADRAAVLALVETTPLEAPPGNRFTYSDLGGILLGQAAESVYGERLDSLLDRRLFRPLGMRHTGYLRMVADVPTVAPTELDVYRGRVLRGQVHDENAWRMGGVSGHAGLFSTAEELLKFGEWWIGQWSGGRADRRTEGGGAPNRPSAGPAVRQSVVREFARRQDLPAGSARALGWETPTQDNTGSALLSPGSVGHTGFTGTSLWIDPGRGVVIVVLANPVHPTRAHTRFNGVRRGVGDRVLAALGACESAPLLVGGTELTACAAR